MSRPARILDAPASIRSGWPSTAVVSALLPAREDVSPALTARLELDRWTRARKREAAVPARVRSWR